MKIITNNFAKRQTEFSPFSHCALHWEQLESLVADHFSEARPGYREGVLLVPVPPALPLPAGWERSEEKVIRDIARNARDRPVPIFFCGVVKVTADTELRAVFQPRQSGEAPFVQVFAAARDKQPAKHVEIVLYSREALAETGDNTSLHADWEIVSINARDTDEPEPMHPQAMARNFLALPGGSKATYTAEQFAHAIIYWSTRALVDPS